MQYSAMNLADITKMFEALSSQIRLDILCLLARHNDDGLVAGKISQHLGLASTSLSFHLKTLLNAGLVTVKQEGRFSRYRHNPAKVLAVIRFLSFECQAGPLPQANLALEAPQESHLCRPNNKYSRNRRL